MKTNTNECSYKKGAVCKAPFIIVLALIKEGRDALRLLRCCAPRNDGLEELEIASLLCSSQ